MFGKSQSGQATIVARQMHEGLYHLKSSTGVYRNIWDYIADVEPGGGGEVFRASFTEIFEGFDGRQPDVGEQAPVTFNKKREVELDRSALLAEQKAADGAREDRFAEIANAAPRTMPAADVPGHTADFSETMAAIAAAREAGNLDEVKRLKAEFAARRAAEP